MTNRPLLEIKQATKTYGGGFLQRKNTVVALQDFNLTIENDRARIVTIAGESGSGKSTLANLVLGFTGLSSGQILFRGIDIEQMSRPEKLDYRRQVQAVFQDPYSVYNPFYQVGHTYQMVIDNFKLANNKNDARDLIEEIRNEIQKKRKIAE